MKKLIYVSMIPLLLAACGSNTDTANGDAQPAEDAGSMMPSDNESTADAMPIDAAGYAAMAGASDLFEIESSKAAMAKSTNAELDKFAQMMVDHHTESTAKIKAAAKAANLTLTPPSLNAMQQKMLDDIKNADASGVDGIYWQHQRAAHEMALKLHQGYAANGDNAEFKKFAGEIVPVVQKHLDEIGAMNAS